MSDGLPHPKSHAPGSQPPPGAQSAGASAPKPKPSAPPGRPASKYVVLTGNPNCGKTTLFNALTGLRAKVGNYAGVTVERKEGKLLNAPPETDTRVLDLPGTYSLAPQSLDEQVSRDVLLNRLPELPAPDLIVVVVDASNLQRNLYYATQVVELGHPTLIALNMVDVAEANGQTVDAALLSAALGVPVLPVVASNGGGLPELRAAIVSALRTRLAPSTIQFYSLPGVMNQEVSALTNRILAFSPNRGPQAVSEALLLLSNEQALASSKGHYPAELEQAVLAARLRLDQAEVDWRGVPIEARYVAVSAIQEAATTSLAAQGETFSDKADRILTHKWWGTLFFILIMGLMFQTIFSFAKLPMDLLQAVIGWVGGTLSRAIPPGDLNSLLVDGVVAGVGAVVVFLPQILLLFLFIGFLEDTGYMARAAFLMDRLMSKVGLHGKSFIPMLSSFACAIPGIMATRTIESPKDRLATILVAPLMSCSARLPVYTLLIAACIPDRAVGFGLVKLRALTLLGIYLLGIVVALAMAWLFKRTLLKGAPPMLILELPPYKRPLIKVVARHMWDRSKLFLRRAGTVILGINILLWFLVTYPRDHASEARFAALKAAVLAGGTNVVAGAAAAEAGVKAADLSTLAREQAGERLRGSFAGRLGRALEPAIAPLGFDWKMGIGIICSFAAREVFVSSMSTVYNLGAATEDEGGSNALAGQLQAQRRPDGSALYTPLLGITLMVFYVFALQCVSTVAVVRRETNSWKWPIFQWLYMGCLAWGLAFLTWQGGHLLGWR